MAAKGELISYVEAGATAELNKGLKSIKALNVELLKSVENANKISDAFKNIKVPSAARGLITQLNTVLATNNQLIQQQISLQDKLKAGIDNTNNSITRQNTARSQSNQRTQEEITNTRLLAANASRAAQANSTFANSYEKLTAQANILGRRVQSLIISGRQGTQTQKEYDAELRNAQREFTALNGRILLADRAIGRFNRNVGNYPLQAARGLKDLIGAFGIVGGVAAFASITKEIFNVTKELQSLDLALRQVIGTQKGFIDAQSFISTTAEKYGVDIQSLTKSYTQFYAAAADKLSETEINGIFDSISKAAGAMGLSVEQQQGAFLALQQMISKGNVQAEEIRGQLAERLPGAFGILAKSMGVTEIELNKLLKDGKVLAADVLPAFAKELEKAYGVENLQRVESLAASTTRLGNTWTQLIREMNEGGGAVTKFFNWFVQGSNNALKALGDLIQTKDSLLKEIGSDAFARGNANAFELITKNANGSEQGLIDWANAVKNKVTPQLVDLANKLETAKHSFQLGEDAGWLRRNLDPSTFKMWKQGKEDVDKYTEALGYAKGELQAAEKILNPEKQRKFVPDAGSGKTKKQKQDIDYLHEVYELQKQNIENQISDEERLTDDIEKNYTDRLSAANNYFFQKDALLKLNHDEEVRLNQLEYAKQKETYEAAIADGRATQENLQQIKYQYQVKAQRIDADYEHKKSDLAIENAKKLQGVLLDIQAQKSRNDLNRIQLGNTSEQTSLFESVTGATSLKQFADLENKLRDINSAQEDAQVGLLNVDLKRNLQEQARIKLQGGTIENNHKLLELQKEQISLEQNLADIEKNRAESVAQLYNEMKQATTDYLQSITQGAFDDAGFASLGKMFDQVTYTVINAAGEIETKVGSTFSKMFDQAQTTTEKIAVAFQTMGDTLQDVFTFLNQNRQAAFDKELTDAERMFEIRKKYAGDSTEAQADLERQLEDKKRDIRIREAKAAKEAALFNIAINTAQAVVAALPNIPLSVTIAALGLAQGIAISSRPLPAYKDGTDFHKGGAAIVGDGGKNEVIWQPKSGYSISPNKDTIMNLERGSKVYPDIASSGLLSSGLSAMNVPSKGLTEEQMDRIMARHLANRPTLGLSIDKRGFNTYQQKSNSKTTIHNNRVSFNGNSITG